MSTQNGSDQYLEVNGALLRWRLSGAGPAIVLLHGWALDLAYWDPVAALLGSGSSVLRFDRRGFGLSTGTPDINRNVDDLVALLDAAGLARATLVGMSQGARLAIHFALRLPARTRALVLDGAPALEAESELPLDDYYRLLIEDGPAALQAAILQHPLMQLATGDRATHRLLTRILTRYHGRDLGRLVTRPRSPDLGNIKAPTLVLNGSLDSEARLQAGRMLHAVIPGAERMELPDAGHLAALDEPRAYANAVETFCRALPD
jgi:pimeloyl-ACP methyl ester carboxylesterase